MFVQIKAKVGNASPSLMAGTITYSCYGLSAVNDIDDIEQFFKDHPLPQNTRTISQIIEVCVGTNDVGPT